MRTPGQAAYDEILDARTVETKRFRSILDSLPTSDKLKDQLVAAFQAGYTAGARDGASIAIEKMKQ